MTAMTNGWFSGQSYDYNTFEWHQIKRGQSGCMMQEIYETIDTLYGKYMSKDKNGRIHPCCSILPTSPGGTRSPDI